MRRVCIFGAATRAAAITTAKTFITTSTALLRILYDDAERTPAGRWTSGARRSGARRGEPSVQPRPRAGAAVTAELVHLQLRRAMGEHGALHPDLHARVGIARIGHELVAGARHDSARQHDRPDP